MALPCVLVGELVKLNGNARDAYFETYARYDPEAPQKPYSIRCGSVSLFSDDTMDLKQQFFRKLANLKRRMGRMKRCRCRKCGKIYAEGTETADYTGYCTQACMHEMSRKLGYRKKNEKFGRSEYHILNDAGKIGSVYVDSEGCVI